MPCLFNFPPDGTSSRNQVATTIPWTLSNSHYNKIWSWPNWESPHGRHGPSCWLRTEFKDVRSNKLWECCGIMVSMESSSVVLSPLDEKLMQYCFLLIWGRHSMNEKLVSVVGKLFARWNIDNYHDLPMLFCQSAQKLYFYCFLKRSPHIDSKSTSLVNWWISTTCLAYKTCNKIQTHLMMSKSFSPALRNLPILTPLASGLSETASKCWGQPRKPKACPIFISSWRWLSWVDVT
jgi:hypothetical protein